VLDRRLARNNKRIARLREELDGAGSAAGDLRAKADLLLSQLHAVRKGDAQVVLSDFAGGTVTIDLDPALEPVDNAHQLYDTARKRERAAERLPALIQQAEREREDLSALRRRVETGQAAPDELERIAEPVRPSAGAAKQPVTALPYRRYRTSGGLEVRVGRGGRANDDLTFRHSSPDDVWLHAREAAGAHVILRWTDTAANPPARDLGEAAVLAALSSRARTSGTVAVDWTRRKYVRKPRKAPPGRVVIERAKTIFVEPDEQLEERLRAAPRP
jgi:predicted ribosome quality control (RQC) complex YloA/Tae2 family protein